MMIHYKKNIIQSLFLVGIMVMLTMCTDDQWKAGSGEGSVPDGYVRISALVQMAPMTQVQTRAVDPDSKGIESIRLYCFDENGLFVTTVSTTLTLTPDELTGYYLSGTFSADIPDYIHCVHIVANQSTDAFRESDYLGKSEKTVMTGLIASSSNMVYWGRVEAGMALDGTTADENETLAETFKRIMNRQNEPYVHLVRNQARVQVTTKADVGFDLEGFYVCNTSAFGTIAPYNEETHAFDWVTNPSNRDYITLPSNQAKSTDPTEVDNSEIQYVFETENTLTDPVSVIVKGTNEGEQSSQYFRILIQDDEYNTLLIKRNHSYNVQIGGTLTPGYASFNEALDGAPVNNVYFTVSDEINRIANDQTELWVQMTDTVLVMTDAKQDFEFEYTYKTGGTPEADDVELTWTGSQNVAEQNFSNTKAISGNTLTGTVTLHLLPMEGELQREGSLLIKAGQLMRTVKVITINKQTFVPTWVSSMVYNGVSGQDFTLMFTVPEDCPQEVFPFDVMVSAPDMDVRSATGMRLDVITKVSDPVRYGNDVTYQNSKEVIGYKFVYPVTEPGTHRIYFKTTFAGQENDQITLENPYFETMKRAYTFTTQHRNIEFTDMATGSVDDLPGNTGTGSEDVFYYLVPRKINAPVNFSFKVNDYSQSTEGTPIQLSVGDELLLYTSHLDKTEQGSSPLEFTEQRQDRNVSGSPWGIYVTKAATSEKYTVNMLTNTPNSAEVVRLASNLSESFYPSGNGGTYNGNTYRSATFELANYRAFEFNAGISADGITDPMQMEQEWSYEYGQQVDVAFDVTSFTAATTVEEEVDPFGTSFKIYIDAPMLEIDLERMNEKRIPTDKFYEENGKFVYVVDAVRETELQDAAGYSVETEVNNGRMERKVLPFKTAKIVNAGNISISAEETMVDFTPQTFTVTNKPITGTIHYMDETSNQEINIPNLAFVSFERTRDNTRIGSVMVGNNGSYQLVLRGEYSYDWAGTEYISFRYMANNGTIYSTVNEKMTLADLFANPNVVLRKE